MCLPRQNQQATATFVVALLFVEVFAPVLVPALPPSSAGVPGPFFTAGNLCAFFCPRVASWIPVAEGSAIELPWYSGLAPSCPSECGSPGKLGIVWLRLEDPDCELEEAPMPPW